MYLGLDPSWRLQSGTRLVPRDLHLAPDSTTRFSLLDPTAACLRPDLTDPRGRAPTTCHLDLSLRTYLPLVTGLRYRLTDTRVCLCLDRWGESLGLDPPTDTRSTPGLAPAMSATPVVHHHHISVPLRLITMDRCLHHTVSVGLLGHAHCSPMTCVSQDLVTTSAHRWTCPQVSCPTLHTPVTVTVPVHAMPSTVGPGRTPA